MIDEGRYRCRKFAIKQFKGVDNPKFAVFMRTPSGQSAKFQYLHETLESAVDSCREYAAQAVVNGGTDFTLYAVEIRHKAGIENGKLVDQVIEK